jgi:hypothetical protein
MPNKELIKSDLAIERLLPEINANHRECQKSGSEALNHAIQAGALLWKLKECVKHGEWKSLIESRCDFSLSSSKTYMLLSKSLPPILKANGKNAGSDMTIRGGMKLIAESKPSKSQKASALTVSAKSGGDSSHKSKTDTPTTAAASVVVEVDVSPAAPGVTVTEPDGVGVTQYEDTFEIDDLTSESKDAFGSDVPAELSLAFQLCAGFDEQCDKLSSIKTWLTQNANHPGARILEGAAQRIRTDLDQARAELKFAKPYCVCVYCHNKNPKVANCTACKGLGWITEPIYKAAPKGLKREKVKA